MRIHANHLPGVENVAADAFSRNCVSTVLALPANLGGIGLINPLDISANQHSMTKKISAPLLQRVIEQDHRSVGYSESQQQIKAAVRTKKSSRLKQSPKNMQEQLPAPLQRSIELSQEKGASTWLTALPIDNHGFALHKTAFRDALISPIWLSDQELTITLQLWSCIQHCMSDWWISID